MSRLRSIDRFRSAILTVAALLSVPHPIFAQYLCELPGLEWVSIGDVGNLNDTTGFGAVSYQYQITRYEITNAQYAAFLNAVARAGDPHQLYDLGMATEPPPGFPLYTTSNAGGIL